jgi:glycine hydroxymethyltransferase
MVLDTCALPYGDARGIRLGTAAVTTQGMGDADMARIAVLFGAAVREEGDVRAEVRELAGKYPPYPG